MRSYQQSTLRKKHVRLEQSLPRYKHSLQISDFVDYHNHLRAYEGASDMEVMVWDAELVQLGATIIKVCIRVIIPVEKNTNIAHNLFLHK